jgi:hypothetical protein
MRSADQERNEAWRDLVCRWKPLFWAEERGQIVSGIGPYLQRRAIERKAYTAREQFVSRGDKAGHNRFAVAWLCSDFMCRPGRRGIPNYAQNY